MTVECGSSVPPVGMVVPNLDGGGAERAMLTLAASLIVQIPGGFDRDSYGTWPRILSI